MRTGEKETATIESAETVNGPSTIGGAMGIALEETLFQWFQWYNDSARVFHEAVFEEKLGLYQEPNMRLL